MPNRWGRNQNGIRLSRKGKSLIRQEHLAKWLKLSIWPHDDGSPSKSFAPYPNTTMQAKSKCGCFNDWKSATPPTSSKCHIGSSALCILINVDLHYSKCIHLLDWFDHKNHICLVSELLGMCLYNFLKENNFQAFPRTHTRIHVSIAWECCM